MGRAATARNLFAEDLHVHSSARPFHGRASHVRGARGVAGGRVLEIAFGGVTRLV